AHLMLHDDGELDADYLESWCERLPPEHGGTKDHQNCLAHLMTAAIDPFRSGGRRTIAQWIEHARLPPSLDRPEPVVEANNVLETYGLSVEIIRHVSAAGDASEWRWLYVANTHRGLAQLFEGSHWAGASGTTSPWVQALRRVSGAEWHRDDDRSKALSRRFAGYKSRATRLPLDALLIGDEGEE